MFKKFNELKRHHKLGFSLLLAAAVISFWRGIWGLSDIFLFPASQVSSYLASIVIGAAIILLAHYVMEG